MIQHFSSYTAPELAKVINSGAIGVLPTDTVYGLVGRANDEAAITRLYSVKRRASQPGTIIAASIDDLVALGFHKEELDKVSHLWPASLSVVLDASDIAPYLKHVRTSLAVRIPDNITLCNLLKQTGPLMTTSANAPGQPTSHTIDEAYHYFGGDIDFYVDVGDLGDRAPSTIIGFDANANIVVYRQGAVSL